jgi:hypothetical protein
METKIQNSPPNKPPDKITALAFDDENLGEQIMSLSKEQKEELLDYLYIQLGIKKLKGT